MRILPTGSSRVEKERLTVRYRGNPEGVRVLVGLLRDQGLKVSSNLSLRLPLHGQAWGAHRDLVETYGTVIDVKGPAPTRPAVRAAIDEFHRRYRASAEIELDA
jgi:hypothetical protein